jgi:hypothetical protein
VPGTLEGPQLAGPSIGSSPICTEAQGPAPSPSHCAYVRIQRSSAVGSIKADDQPQCRLVLVQVVTGNLEYSNGMAATKESSSWIRQQTKPDAEARDRHQRDTQSG